MQLQDFWERMRAAFGPLSESFAMDHVMSELGGRTVVEALGEGFSTREIWEAVVANRGLGQAA